MITARPAFRLIAAALLAGAAACSRGGDTAPPREGGEPARTPPPAERIALWRRQSPGEPLPASLTLARPLGDEEIRVLLAEYRLRPYTAHLRVAGLTGTHRVPEAEASPELIGAARGRALEVAASSACQAGARLDAMAQADTGRGAGERPGLERAMLTRVELGRRSIEAVRRGEPVIYGLKVLGPPEQVERVAGDPRVSRVEPGMRLRIRGAERVVVSDPVPPNASAAPETLPDVQALSDEQVRARLAGIARAPLPECAALASAGVTRPGGLPAPPRLPAGQVFALLPGAERGWTARELTGAPRSFAPHGWVGDGALWGLAGETPWRVPLAGGAPVSWRTRAWVADLAPDGRRLAWIDAAHQKVLVAAPGEAPRTVLDLAAARPPEGADPSGALAWSPDGARLLVGWAEEWNGIYGVVEVATGRFTRLRTRLQGYYLVDFGAWLDANRLLFTAQAVPPQYSESGGPRTDLFVLDLRDGGYRKVTSVPEGAHLWPQGRWGEGAWLVGEAVRVRHLPERWWAYDTRTWERRPVPLPLARRAVAQGPDRVVLVTQTREDDQATALHLWRGPGARAEPLAVVRGRELRVAWSPDGRRLFVTRGVEEPVAGLPDATGTRWRTHVLEMR